MGSRDDEFRAWNGHWVGNFAENGVNRCVKSENLLEHILVKGELGKILILERW